MKTNYFSIIFWFNICNKHHSIIENLQKEFQNEYKNFNIFNYTNDLILPIVSAINNEKMTNIKFSQINLQYSMDRVSISDFEEFKEKSIRLLTILNENDIKVIHTSIFVNGEFEEENSIKKITKNTIAKNIYSQDLVDVSLKFGKKYEDLFYKIITLCNKKQIKLPRTNDELGREVPIPLVSWNGALVEKEMIEISYEINDKYLYDFTKNYNTTEFYLYKMLYIISESFEDDVKSIINDGKF